MLKPALNLRLGQSLSMTPQLQQAIRLLQLSSLELQSEIQQIFETNPMLEKDEEGSSSEQEPSNSAEKDSEEFAEGGAEQEIDGSNDQIVDDLPVDSNWEDVYQASNIYSETPKEPARDVYENESGSGNSLQDYLLQ